MIKLRCAKYFLLNGKQINDIIVLSANVLIQLNWRKRTLVIPCFGKLKVKIVGRYISMISKRC